MTMQETITKGFKKLNQRLIDENQSFAKHKYETSKDFVEKARAENHPRHQMFDGKFYQRLALVEHYGSKGMMDLLHDRGLNGALEMMLKNTKAVIANRDSKIIKSFSDIDVYELPDFELIENSNGYEGTFKVDCYTVTITTILAGGYNIQRLHQRTKVKIK